ncbi:MAG: hypothetical protein VR69_12105 [Peptococcaceae bacterium BRH_c4b]|nr:MAG: hypothetical protein VR69_12105 [Peptococcaceae bacterium BRH_c4b]
MRNYWVMKTFKDWWTIFVSSKIVGIDEDGIDDNYLTITNGDLDYATTNLGINDEKDRFFRNFCKWMQIGDYIIIGTGKQTEFNVVGIVRVISDYIFDANAVPRHYRSVEFLKTKDYPGIEMNRFKRASLIEHITEQDFVEAISSLIP